MCVDSCAEDGASYIDGTDQKRCLSKDKCAKYVLKDETTKLCYDSCRTSGNLFETDDRCYEHCPEEK